MCYYPNNALAKHHFSVNNCLGEALVPDTLPQLQICANGQSHEKSFKKLPSLGFPSDSKPRGNRHESPWISLILSHSWVRWRATTFQGCSGIHSCMQTHTFISHLYSAGKGCRHGHGMCPRLYSDTQCPCRSSTCHVLVPTWDPTVVWAGHAKLQLGYVALMKSLQAESSISWLTAQESPAPILKEAGKFSLFFFFSFLFLMTKSRRAQGAKNPG